MKIHIIITQEGVIDTDEIEDRQIRVAAERIAFNREKDLVGKTWVADWAKRRGDILSKEITLELM